MSLYAVTTGEREEGNCVDHVAFSDRLNYMLKEENNASISNTIRVMMLLLPFVDYLIEQ